MRFRSWLQQESVWYHGTQAGDQIRKSEIQVSLSGGGQRGLKGVWLTQDPDYAMVYAKSSKEAPGDPEVVAVNVPDNLKIANLYELESDKHFLDAERERWKFVGYDIDDMEGMAPVRDIQPFAMTKLLMQQGYDGALIPNTINKGGAPELVVFDPQKLQLREEQSGMWTPKLNYDRGLHRSQTLTRPKEVRYKNDKIDKQFLGDKNGVAPSRKKRKKVLG